MSDIPPALAALYASEQAAAGVPDADRERIRAGVLAAVGVAAAATSSTASAATTAAGSITTKLVVALVAVGALGGGAALLSARRATADVAVPEVSTRADAYARIDPPPPHVVAEPAPPAAPPPQAIAASPVAAPTPSPIPESDAHRLARAAALSARGEAAGALALLETVASTSVLAEERDALRVATLAKLGRTDDACTAAAAFVVRFPTSIHRAAVEEVPCSSAP